MLDTTSFFKETCRGSTIDKIGLKTGLDISSAIRIPTITPLEAMNALQVMDPKMDSGRCSTIRTAFDPSKILSQSQVCWLIDEMVAKEIAWYQGFTLCQTVFTCNYYHHVHLCSESSPVMSAFRAYVLAYLKSIDLAYSELLKGHVNDGEDCWLDHYGVPIRTEDQVTDVVLDIDEAIAALSTGFPSLADRLVIRRNLLAALEAAHDGKTNDTRSVIDRIALSTDAVDGVFDEDMSAHLRQHMPLPDSPCLHRGYRGISHLLYDLATLQVLPCLDQEVFLRGVGWRSDILAITRSMCKSFIFPVDNVTAIPQSTHLANKWLSEATDLPANALDYLATVVIDPKQYKFWRSFVEGYTITTASVPLLNRSRQRRTLHSASFAWLERAVTAENLFSSAYAAIVAAMHSKRLDCLLEAALAGYDLGLITADEERLSWWWIHEICSHRLALRVVRTFDSQWAELWLLLSAAMQLLLTSMPMSSSSLGSQAFKLRFKWARKRLGVVRSSTAQYLRPRYEAWRRAEAQLETRENPVGQAITYLSKARDLNRRIRGMFRQDQGTDYFLSVLADLSIDIDNNLQVCQANTALRWERRSKWLPLLRST